MLRAGLNKNRLGSLRSAVKKAVCKAIYVHQCRESRALNISPEKRRASVQATGNSTPIRRRVRQNMRVIDNYTHYTTSFVMCMDSSWTQKLLMTTTQKQVIQYGIQLQDVSYCTQLFVYHINYEIKSSCGFSATFCFLRFAYSAINSNKPLMRGREERQTYSKKS